MRNSQQRQQQRQQAGRPGRGGEEEGTAGQPAERGDVWALTNFFFSSGVTSSGYTACTSRTPVGNGPSRSAAQGRASQLLSSQSLQEQYRDSRGRTDEPGRGGRGHMRTAAGERDQGVSGWVSTAACYTMGELSRYMSVWRMHVDMFSTAAVVWGPGTAGRRGTADMQQL